MQPEEKNVLRRRGAEEVQKRKRDAYVNDVEIDPTKPAAASQPATASKTATAVPASTNAVAASSSGDAVCSKGSGTAT